MGVANFVFGALTLVILAVGTFYGIRIPVRRDREDRAAAKQAALRATIDAAIAAERDRRELEDTREENAELKRRLGDG